jgi:hypothetical protein
MNHKSRRCAVLVHICGSLSRGLACDCRPRGRLVFLRIPSQTLENGVTFRVITDISRIGTPPACSETLFISASENIIGFSLSVHINWPQHRGPFEKLVDWWQCAAVT